MVENLRICNLRTAHFLRIFADMRYAAQSREICRFEIFGLTYLRNLGIFDCKLSPRIWGLKKFACPPLQICHRCQPYWRQSCRWCTLSCEYFLKFLKNLKQPNGILRGLGDTDWWKNWNRKYCGTVPLKFLLNEQNWKPQLLTGIPIQLEAIFHDCEST